MRGAGTTGFCDAEIDWDNAADDGGRSGATGGEGGSWKFGTSNFISFEM